MYIVLVCCHIYFMFFRWAFLVALPFVKYKFVVGECTYMFEIMSDLFQCICLSYTPLVFFIYIYSFNKWHETGIVSIHLLSKICRVVVCFSWGPGTQIPDLPFSSFGPSHNYGMDLSLEVFLWAIYSYFTTFRVTTLSFY